MATPTPRTFAASSGAHCLAGRVAALIGRTGDVIVTGDSLTDSMYNFMGARWGFPRTMYPPRIIHNDGIQAQDMTQIVNRLQATITSHPTANTYVMRMGTNGPGNATTYQAQFQRAIDICALNSKFAIFLAMPPRGDDSVQALADRIAGNNWIAAACAASPSTLLFINDSVDLGDAGYHALPSYYATDQIHMNAKGVVAQGERQVTPFLSTFAHIDPRVLDPADKYPATNQYVANGLMAGTGGTLVSGTGVMPTYWVAEAFGTVSFVMSIVPADAGDPVQVPWMRCTINSCSGGDNMLALRTTMLTPEFTADVSTVKRFDKVAEVRAVNVNGAALRELNLWLDRQNYLKETPAGLTFPSEIVNAQFVLRHSYARDAGTSASTKPAEAFPVNGLHAGLWFSFNASASPIGSIDIRCVSVRGSAT